ncbi:MAG TPA: trypsin-like peptidase domain-containing protein [Treponemataceae bacterium]|nr:trypsin-like peptidase domain-containing protein [Treponemataceae bacterium]
MKLYTKRHILIAIICTLLLGGLLYSAFLIGEKTTPSTYKTENIIIDQQKHPVLVDSPSINAHIDTTTAYTQDEQQNIYVYDTYSEAVVNISTKVVGYNWFLEAISQDGGTGSGSIIDKDGYIVTNRHVVNGAYKIYVSLADGTQYEARLIGQDEQTDLAVLKFNPPKDLNITSIPFSNSSTLKVGQKVIAIGNPFGFDRTMTTGIISSLQRPIKNSDNIIIQNMIQTDTSINPGNSGGPLLNTQGQMVGINTMIYSTSGSSAGVGFAVPTNTAKRVVSDIIKHGKVQRGFIDEAASLVQLNSSIAEYAHIPQSTGLLISELYKNGTGEKAGLKAGTKAVRYGSVRSNTVFYIGGDVITAVNNKKVDTLAMFNSLLEDKKPGDTIVLSILRGRKTLDIDIVLTSEK